MADSFQVQADVHGGGPASLALVCAIPNSEYFEVLVPEPVLPDATLRGPILPDSDGWVYPEEVPGIGWDPNPEMRVP